MTSPWYVTFTRAREGAVLTLWPGYFLKPGAGFMACSSKMARFRRRLEIVVQHIEILDRRLDQLLGVDAVEAVDPHSVGRVPARIAAERVGAHAARATEDVVDALAPELVVAEVVFAGEQPEVRRGHGREPPARLEADRAVAFEGALSEVHVRLESHGAAMAAAL